ncbi:MAG: response regulator [Natrialbaceae archaeon]|nr:response regulator [Natrialbaceae archaeon]
MKERTILVVDDEPDVAESYALRLQGDYDVKTATGGEEALSMIDEDIDVVLLDRRMPEMSGDEVLSRIRYRNLDPSVAMLTAVEPDLDVAIMPFDDYLIKPVEREQLLSAIDRMLEAQRKEDLERELSSKKVRRNVLEVEKDDEELGASDLFQQLETDIKALEAELTDSSSAGVSAN